MQMRKRLKMILIIVTDRSNIELRFKSILC